MTEEEIETLNLTKKVLFLSLLEKNTDYHFIAQLLYQIQSIEPDLILFTRECVLELFDQVPKADDKEHCIYSLLWLLDKIVNLIKKEIDLNVKFSEIIPDNHQPKLGIDSQDTILDVAMKFVLPIEIISSMIFLGINCKAESINDYLMDPLNYQKYRPLSTVILEQFFAYAKDLDNADSKESITTLLKHRNIDLGGWLYSISLNEVRLEALNSLDLSENYFNKDQFAHSLAQKSINILAVRVMDAVNAEAFATSLLENLASYDYLQSQNGDEVSSVKMGVTEEQWLDDVSFS